MKYEYPVDIRENATDEASKYLKGASNKTGYYPIGRMNTWHGGVHFEGDKAIKAIGDGKIIAFRVPANYYEETLQGKTSKYSNGFVLIQHGYVSPSEKQKMTFYSFYNHLLPFDEMKGKKIPDIFKCKISRVKTTVKDVGTGTSFMVKGLRIRKTPKNGAIVAVAAVGSILFLADEENNTGSWRKVNYTSPNGTVYNNHYVYTEPKGEQARIFNDQTANTLKVLLAEDEFHNGDKGLRLRKKGNTNSEIVKIIPKGTVVEIAATDKDKKGWLKIESIGENSQRVNGYVHDSGLESDSIPVLTEKELNSVKNVCIEVKAGTTIGFTGLYGFEKHEQHRVAHVEVFTPDEVKDFLTNKHGDGEKKKDFVLLPEGHELKNTIPHEIRKNSRLKLLSGKSKNWQQVEVENIDLTVTDRDKELGDYSRATNSYTFTSAQCQKLAAFNKLVDDVAIAGDKILLVEQLEGKKRKVRYNNPAKGKVFWVKHKDITKLPLAVAETSTTGQTTEIDVNSGSPETTTTSTNAVSAETPTQSRTATPDPLVADTAVAEPPAVAPTTINTTTPTAITSNSVTRHILNKDLTEIYLLNPENTEGEQKVKADAIINLGKKSYTDKANSLPGNIPTGGRQVVAAVRGTSTARELEEAIAN